MVSTSRKEKKLKPFDSIDKPFNISERNAVQVKVWHGTSLLARGKQEVVMSMNSAEVAGGHI